jgi:hypothetical protein
VVWHFCAPTPEFSGPIPRRGAVAQEHRTFCIRFQGVWLQGGRLFTKSREHSRTNDNKHKQTRKNPKQHDHAHRMTKNNHGRAEGPAVEVRRGRCEGWVGGGKRVATRPLAWRLPQANLHPLFETPSRKKAPTLRAFRQPVGLLSLGLLHANGHPHFGASPTSIGLHTFGHLPAKGHPHFEASASPWASSF